ncbi:MAG: SpoIIE family protein phosphatase [Roseiflexaceae bacterium]|nr:SpoIIE family protein phosphatase [Roseiflexaceae bacterium]
MPVQSDAKQRAGELTLLNTLALALNRADDVRDTLETALRHTIALMGLNSGWIFLRDESGVFRLLARAGLPPAIEYPGRAWNDTCECQNLCDAGGMTKSFNLVRCSRLRYAVGDKRSLYKHASVPIKLGDATLGILNVATTEFGQFTVAQTQLLSMIGLMIGVAISQVRLNAQVRGRRAQEQAALLQLSQDLLDTAAIESALQRLVRVGARLLEAEACAFIAADEASGRAMLQAAHGWRFLPPAGLPVPVDTRNPHLWYLPEQSTDLPSAALDALPQMLAAQGFHGHMAKEVLMGGAPVGLLMLNTRGPRQFTEEDAQLLAILANQAAQAFDRERLQQEVNERRRLERELDIAREIQASFLPDCCPSVPGYDIAAFYRAARQIGGDFYDFITLDGAEDDDGRRRLGVVIADVTDKGVPAALFMALSRTVLRATALGSRRRAPAEVLAFANKLILADSRAGLFVTTFYGVLDPQTGAFTYANGGHNYPLLYHAATGEVEPLQALGLVLGVMPDPRFEERRVTLAPGDVLCLYTDGVTEAMNSRRQLFEEHRLIDVLRASHQLPAEQIIERILAAVARFTAGAPQTDDITLVIIKASG